MGARYFGAIQNEASQVFVGNPLLMPKTTPNTRWGRLGDLHHTGRLEQLSNAMGMTPEVHACEHCTPPYRAGMFQVIVRPDGIWIHASLLRKWQRRQFYTFLADCDLPSGFRQDYPCA